MMWRVATLALLLGKYQRPWIVDRELALDNSRSAQQEALPAVSRYDTLWYFL